MPECITCLFGIKQIQHNIRNNKILVDIMNFRANSGGLTNIKMIVLVIHVERKIDRFNLKGCLGLHHLAKLNNGRVTKLIRICD